MAISELRTIDLVIPRLSSGLAHRCEEGNFRCRQSKGNIPPTFEIPLVGLPATSGFATEHVTLLLLVVHRKALSRFKAALFSQQNLQNLACIAFDRVISTH